MAGGTPHFFPASHSLALWLAPYCVFGYVFSIQMVLQVLEFDLRSGGGTRPLLVTSSAAVFDDGEVREEVR